MLRASAFFLNFANKLEIENIMETPIHYDTLSLIGSCVDGVHIILHNIFRMLKPVRHKYRITVNGLMVLNAIYLYHKYKGSLISMHSLYDWFRYYNKPKLQWYVNYLIEQGCIIMSDRVKAVRYYRISEKGIKIMADVNNTYQDILRRYIEDNGISL